LAVAGIAPIHAAGASDLVLRNVNTGAFEVYDIAGNTLVGAARRIWYRQRTHRANAGQICRYARRAGCARPERFLSTSTSDNVTLEKLSSADDSFLGLPSAICAAPLVLLRACNVARIIPAFLPIEMKGNLSNKAGLNDYNLSQNCRLLSIRYKC